MKVYVRNGNIGDISWMLEQLEAFQLFYGSKHSLFDKEFAADRLEEWISKDLVLVAERNEIGRLGFIIGAITPHLFNPKVTVLAELLWWVDPIYRTTKAGYLLLREFVNWGKKNADWITFSLQTITPIREETLKKLGFRHVEAAYLIEVGCKNGSSSDSSFSGSDGSDIGSTDK